MIQQTIQIGNSIGVIIPKNILKEKKIKVGDKIHVEVKPVAKNAGNVNPRFMQMVEEFTESHKDVLAELANK